MLRSWLFIPGSNDKHLQKAEDLDADILIFDLEDAVALHKKAKARKNVTSIMKTIEDKDCYVRVNALSTPYFLQDIEGVVCHKLDGIMLPKVSSKEDIIIADYLLQQMELKNNLPVGSILIVPLIENASGVHNAFHIASASNRISCFAFGAEDFKLDLSIDTGCSEQELLYARSKLVTAARAAGIEAPIDSVYTAIDDNDGLLSAVRSGKNLGFQGKLAIHPKQLKVINDVYSFTEEQIKEAKEIVKVYDQSIKKGDGAIEWHGKMIDSPIAEKAREMLEKENRQS